MAKKSFWVTQLKTSWANLTASSLWARVGSFSRTSRQLLGRHRAACAVPLVGWDLPSSEKLTVVLMNHKRPENVAMIVRYTLRAGFVGKLVVSNNSQDYPIEAYVRQKDERLVLLNQERPSGVGIRFELARRYAGRYCLCIDDDIFLHPAQLQWIYLGLRTVPERPQGIFGAEFTPSSADPRWPFVHSRGRTGEVDILNGLFAFTQTHLNEYFRLCAMLGIDDPKSLMNGEDIVLSFTGRGRPLIHNVGPIWECASASTPGVALHMSRPGFYEERWRLYSELRAARPMLAEASG